MGLPPYPDAEREAAIVVTGLGKTFGRSSSGVVALAGIDARFLRGELTVVMGPSGSGKSTLLYCVAGLEAATTGSINLGGRDVTRLSDNQLTDLRRDALGFVFQAYNLIPTLTAAENIRLAERLGGPKLDSAWIDQLVEVLGIGSRLKHLPHELSGGQQQRVAIARALAHRPAVVLADEPTGNLDSRASAAVLGFLRRAVDDLGQTVVMVTHDPLAATYADRALFLRDGFVVDDTRDTSAQAVLTRLGGLGSDE